MKFENIDYHVHCGQYNEVYYQPETIINCLARNGIKEAWISSTTSNIEWDTDDEKGYILNHIEDEIREAFDTGVELGVKVRPLYWVIPKRFIEGESIESIMNDSIYKGFKIHPKNNHQAEAVGLMDDVCKYASKNNLPVLIHTGVDVVDYPLMFDKYINSYPKVTFVLAHCKMANEIVGIFSKYINVFGDVSFCPKESYEKINKNGFGDRLLFGTDFPIGHYIEQKNVLNKHCDEYLIEKYRNTIKGMLSI